MMCFLGFTKTFPKNTKNVQFPQIFIYSKMKKRKSCKTQTINQSQKNVVSAFLIQWLSLSQL